MKVKIGNPVENEDFFQRNAVVDRLVDDIRNQRGSRSLFGLRRIGKSSVLRAVKERLDNQTSLVVISIDVQGISRLGDFLAKIVEDLPERHTLQNYRAKIANNQVVQTLFTAIASKYGYSGVTPTKDASAQGGFINEMRHMGAWIGDINDLLKAHNGIVLLIDELPFMLRNMLRSGYSTNDVECFMAMLRDWRMNCDVRMILAGSLGLGQLARLEGVQTKDHTGDLYPVSLPPLGREEAIEMVTKLAEGEGLQDWTHDLSAAIVDGAAETWPIFLQMGLDAAIRSNIRDVAILAQGPDPAASASLEDTFFSQYQTRLNRYNDDKKPAQAVLRLVTHSPQEGVSLDIIDQALAKIGAKDDRDTLIEGLIEDDFVELDTKNRTVHSANRLVTVWVRARSWGV